ncbi:MAG: hypothetical protein ACPLUL_03030 [Thermanaerothrix sp.]|uniref:hypothetical protein n=1 Tax=Thermanaerothrix sp. TaxID=2972675 RepID=UPI003C7C846F
MASKRGVYHQDSSLSDKSGQFSTGIAVGTLALGAIGVMRADWWFTTYIPSQWPGADWMVLLIGALAGATLWTLAYYAIAYRVGTAGNDYQMATRHFNTPIGFAGSFVLMASSALFVGGVVIAFFRSWLPGLLRTAALVLPQYGLDSLSEAIQAPQLAILLGVIVILMAFLTVLFSPRGMKVLMVIGMVLVAVWGIAWTVSLFVTPTGKFAQMYEGLYGSGIIDRQINLAVSFGLILTRRPWSSFLLGMGFSVWLFQGIVVPLSGLSLNRVKSSSLLGWLIGELMVIAMVIGVTVLFLQQSLPPNLLAAHGWLYLRQATQPEFFLPWAVFYFVITHPSLLLVIGIVLTWGVWLINLIQAYFFAIAQGIAAWAKDGLVSSSWGYQQRGQQVPAVGLFGAALLALLGMAIGLGGNWVHLVLYYPYAFAMASIGPLIGLIRYAWYQRKGPGHSSKEIQNSKGWIWAFLVGIAALAIMIGVIGSAWVLPREMQISRDFGVGLILLWVIALGWYWRRVNFWRQRGVNLNETLHRASSHSGG